MGGRGRAEIMDREGRIEEAKRGKKRAHGMKKEVKVGEARVEVKEGEGG